MAQTLLLNSEVTRSAGAAPAGSRLTHSEPFSLFALLAFALVAGLSGCGPRPVRSVTNPDPSGAIPAIEQATQAHDRSVIPQLVKGLDNEDPAIRLYSIEGLRRMTGQTFGFRYYDDESQRQDSLNRWRQWLVNHGR